MASIYVGNLHAEVTRVLLLKTFSPAGHVQSVRICRERKSGSSLGYGFVNFDSRADAARALDMFNFKLLLGKPMRVMWSHYDSRVKINKKGNIFLKNLDPFIDNLALYDTFCTFGRIMSCKVVFKNPGYPGHGYIQFETEESAESAIKQLDGKLLNDYQVTIEHFKSLKQREEELQKKREEENMHELQSPCIFIKNLDKSIDDKQLYWTFSSFGTIREAKVLEENGQSLGFVCFSSPMEATIARKKMNGVMCGKNPMHIDVAIISEEREAQLALLPVQLPYFSNDTIPEDETHLNNVPAFQPVESVDIVTAKTASSLNNIPDLRLDTVPDTETCPAVDFNSAEIQSENIPETTQVSGEVDEVLSSDASSTERQLVIKNKPITPPRKKLTIYMLKSVQPDEQILMAYKYMLPLIKEIHPAFAENLTWKLLEEKTNFEIVTMLEDLEMLRTKVEELVAHLKAKHGDLKPENLKSIFSINMNKKKRKKGKNRRYI